MSDEVIIQVEGLGKRYRLGQQSSQRYTALRDVLTEKAKGLFRVQSAKRKANGATSSALGSSPLARTEDLWALRDVSFSVRRGEVVGIIGRNGAGKSTLLKILSRITEPTEGRVRLRGRVASLLEVGTGFHPELTGRENIFLNGAILGMTKAEIKSKFDEIVAFAEIERFLDTPVKRYSSGMYVRLAFAVAAHLEPEILLVDEVLAVGDAEFQKKCLGKMQDVSRGGRTVLFVSHNMAAVQHLCLRAILLREGQLLLDGNTGEVIERYVSSTSSDMETRVDLRHHKNRLPGAISFFTEMEITVNGIASNTPRMGEGLDINPEILKNAPPVGAVFCRVPSLNLTPNIYHITVISADSQGELDRIENCCAIDVLTEDVFRTGKTPGRHHGVIFLPAEWDASWSPKRPANLVEKLCSKD